MLFVLIALLQAGSLAFAWSSQPASMVETRWKLSRRQLDDHPAAKPAGLAHVRKLKGISPTMTMTPDIVRPRRSERVSGHLTNRRWLASTACSPWR